MAGRADPKRIPLVGMPSQHSTERMGHRVQLILLLPLLRAAEFGE